MTPLTQQLEDKKKGCGIDLGAYMEVPKEYENAPDKIRKEKSFRVEVICGKQEYCPTCKSNIAILEQAIAEIKKQRQDFIDIINSLGEIRGKSNDLQCIKLGESFSTNSVEWLKKELLKQLNQPKEEEEE